MFSCAQVASLGGLLTPAFNGDAQQAIGLMHIGRIEVTADLARHHSALVDLADVALRVVLQVKLAALPRHPGNIALRAAFRPAWSSLAMNFTPRKPR